MAQDGATPVLVFPIGNAKGITITMTRSRLSRMVNIKEALGDGEHIALGTQGNFKWGDPQCPKLHGTDLLACFEDAKADHLETFQEMFWQLYPEYKSIPLSELGFQYISNDDVSAVREDVHAHVAIAKKATWGTKRIPRVVDPIEPIPADKVKPR